jgi:hypothetical protein
MSEIRLFQFPQGCYFGDLVSENAGWKEGEQIQELRRSLIQLECRTSSLLLKMLGSTL